MTRLFDRTQVQVERQLSLLRDDMVKILSRQEPPTQRQASLNQLLSHFSSLVLRIDHVEVIDTEEQRLIGWRRPGASSSRQVPLTMMLQDNDKPLGMLLAGWDASDTYKMIEQDISEARYQIFIVLLLTAGVLLFWVQVLVSQPLNQIKQRLLLLSEQETLPMSWWAAREFQQLMVAANRIDEVTIANDKLETEMERRKDAEVELLNVRDEALYANRAKSVFLANMSHELRTPLNAIIGYSEILEEEFRNNEQTDYVKDLERIQQSGRHLLVLINEVLDLSKIEAGKMELHLESFHLHEIVEAVVVTVNPMMEKSGNTINIQGVESILPMRADVTRVRQILFNLLSNAIKFTENGEIILSAEHKVRKEVDGVQLLVIDSGIGLNEEDIETLFIPFQQADVSTTRKYGGTGLGLSLCRHLCKMMQGDIWVESKPGQGATFGIWLPLTVNTDVSVETPIVSSKRADPKNVRLSADVLRLVKGNKERRKRIATVLTIDDDPNVVDLMARVYQREGFRPVSASNGKMGIELARQLRPDLITLDIMMPGMDGWTVLKALKEDPDLKDIPVIMVSIVGDGPVALEVGAMASLTKPIAWDKLLDLTRSVVREENNAG